MTCPSDETLVLFADAPQEPADSAVREHLPSCPSCSDRVSELRRSLADWRSSDLVDTSEYDDHYFRLLAMDVERGLDLAASNPSPQVLPQLISWWRRTPGLVAALAAVLLLAVGLLRGPGDATPPPEEALALAESNSLEALARELGKSLLDPDEGDEFQDEEEAATFLASWNVSRHEQFDDISPFPLTTTLADEFDLLDSEQVNSLITRL